MRPLRSFRARTSVEVTTLVVLALAGALAMALAMAFPISPSSPRHLQVLALVSSLSLASLLVVFGDRVRTWMLHAIIGMRSVMLGAMIASAATREAATALALFYVWSAIYAALFFSPRATRAHTALMIACYGVATLVADASTGVTIWLVMSMTVGVSAIVLNNLATRLRGQARADALTGLLNRAGLAHAAARERSIADRDGTEVAVAVIDLDDFKLVNDHGGHAAGDRLLVDLAATWRSVLRARDLLARYGGDEFVVVMPDTPPDDADAILERLACSHPGRWTAGVVSWTTGETLSDAIGRADAMLYGAKSTLHAAAAAPA